jgi:hypothetical protein
MMAASQVDGATLLRMMLLGTYTRPELSVIVQWESGISKLYLKQDVRDKKCEKCHVVIITRHIQVFSHALNARITDLCLSSSVVK